MEYVVNFLFLRRVSSEVTDFFRGVYNITRYSGIYTQNLFIPTQITSKQTEVTIVLKYAVRC